MCDNGTPSSGSPGSSPPTPQPELSVVNPTDRATAAAVVECIAAPGDGVSGKLSELTPRGWEGVNPQAGSQPLPNLLTKQRSLPSWDPRSQK